MCIDVYNGWTESISECSLNHDLSFNGATLGGNNKLEPPCYDQEQFSVCSGSRASTADEMIRIFYTSRVLRIRVKLMILIHLLFGFKLHLIKGTTK